MRGNDEAAALLEAASNESDAIEAFDGAVMLNAAREPAAHAGQLDSPRPLGHSESLGGVTG